MAIVKTIFLLIFLNQFIYTVLSEDLNPPQTDTAAVAEVASLPIVPPSGNVTLNLESWIETSLIVFKNRTEEIEKGIETSLDPELQNAENKKRVITVRKDGSGDFKSITDALKSIPEINGRRIILDIGPGLYREKIQINRQKKFITFYGDPNDMPTISWGDTAAKFGTMNSATVGVDSNYFMAINIIFRNTAPMPADGAQGGQAVALRINGDKAAFYNCKFYGFQDTLCDNVGKHYFKDCFIQGTVDFIFGNGRSLYEGCEINSVAKSVTAITAQGRDVLKDKSGFSFVNCKITGTGNAYLSRAWKQSSRVVFANTYMGGLVNFKGWDNRGFNSRDKTVYYGEYKCSGPGASTESRVNYGRLLTDQQAKPFLSKTFIRAATWLLPPPALNSLSENSKGPRKR